MVLGTTNATSITVGIVPDTLVRHNCHIHGGINKFLKSNYIETWQVVCDNVTNEGVITVTAIYRSLPRVYSTSKASLPFCDNMTLSAEAGIRDAQESRGLGDVYKRQFLYTLGKLRYMAVTIITLSFVTLSQTTCNVSVSYTHLTLPTKRIV